MRTQMIESYIRQLRNSLGLKRPIDDERLYTLYQANDYAGMIGVVMTAFNLDLRVNLGLVNSGGPRAHAWLKIPQPFPFIFSPNFRNTEVTLFIRKSFLAEAGFESTVLAISHELGHAVLHAINSPLKKEEEAVDLTAMLLGSRDFYVTGSVVKGKEGDYGIGYLTQEEMSHAAWFMTYGQ